MADDDLDILAWTMLGEAGGEGTQGMADVGHVVLNRVNSGKYGASIQDVALAPKQFSTWNSGAGGNDPKGKYPKDSAAFQRARQIAEQVVAGTIPGPPGMPLDYNAPSVSPYWASSKAKHGTYERNGHVFYPSVPVPPGELPEVASALSTVPTPRNAPAPVTPSIDLAQYRKNVAPSQLGPETFAALSKPKRYLGDEIGMSPIPGGKQQAPLFDAGFDTRTNSMRLFSNGPADTQGVFAGASKAPAPIPRMPSPQLMGKRATDPALQAALNAKYPAQLPPTGPTTRSVQSIPIPQVPVPRPAPERASNVTAYSSLSKGSSVPENYRYTANMGKSQPMTVEQMYAGIYPTEPGQFRIGSTDGLGPGNPAGRISTAALTGEVGPNGLPVTAPLKMPPIPFQRPAAPTQFATAPRIAPVTFMRPTGVGTQLSVRPMPPMPVARPDFGMGGPFRVAPVPLPRSARPAAQPVQMPTYSPAMLQQMAAQAVSRSGDTSVGSQADAAAARSSGEGGRNRRY